MPEDRRENKLEKVALSVLGTVIVAILLWVVSTVDDNKLAFAVIQEKLSNQTNILLDVQEKQESNAEWKVKLESRMSVQESRVKELFRRLEQ